VNNIPLKQNKAIEET